MKIYYSLIVALLLIIAGGVYLPKQQEQKQGSIASDAFAFYGTTTDSTWSSLNGEKILKNGPGILGIVNIPNANAGTLCLYDGTTTQTHANYATTSMGCFATNATAGSYQYNTAFARGLVAVWSATALGISSSTITWK